LDAGVLIAFFQPDDPHHATAVTLLTEHADDLLYLGALTEAEVLVRAAQRREEATLYAHIRELGVTVLPLPADAGPWLAQLRARTGSRLPDCSVILTAQQSGSRIATFDRVLARAASELGIEVIPS